MPAPSLPFLFHHGRRPTQIDAAMVSHMSDGVGRHPAMTLAAARAVGASGHLSDRDGQKPSTSDCLFRHMRALCSGKRGAATVVASVRRSLHSLVGKGYVPVHSHWASSARSLNPGSGLRIDANPVCFPACGESHCRYSDLSRIGIQSSVRKRKQNTARSWNCSVARRSVLTFAFH